jgi:S-adenosylmethionine synthetase
MVDTFGTGSLTGAQLTEMVRANFSLTPKGIIDTLQLRRPIYKATAAFGHFGRKGDSFSWEKTDKVEALKTAAKSYALAAAGR